MTNVAGDRAACAERARAAGLDPARLPKHVAIVMDGNGRWAKGKGWERTRGHKRGAETVRTVTTESVKLGIERLTLYAFSSENWSRPALEVGFLMRLLDDFLQGELPTLIENDVRLTAIGRLDRLPREVRATVDRTLAATERHRAMTLCLALSYGGRDEIVDACRAVVDAVQRGEIARDAIDAAAIQARLYAPAAPDVDVVIRTAGEHRLSNFLPWQAVYAEYVAVPAFWPDFSASDYHGALREFQARERRFGGV